MKKYSWDFNRDAERWWNNTFDTIEECLADARQENKLNGNRYTAVFIGENCPFIPRVDVESILDHCEDQAGDEVGEIGYDWSAYDHKKDAEIDELQRAMDEVLHNWMKKHGYYPEIYSVDEIKRFDLLDKEEIIDG